MQEPGIDLWKPAGQPDIAPPPRARGPAFAAAARNWRGAVRYIADIVYPPTCIACRRATQTAGTLCAGCWAKMPFIERPYCERLGTPFEQDLGPGIISPEAFANPPVFNRARAVARYEEGPARDLVHNLKYGDRLELADAMGLWMARAGAELLADKPLVVPVPLHRRRLFSRRFNQAASLAQVVAKISGASFDPLALVRVKPTIPQVGLTRAQRADNVQGAFRVPEEARLVIAGRNILLVDDVLTSGATANAASRILQRAGAARVDVLTFARVVRDGNMLAL